MLDQRTFVPNTFVLASSPVVDLFYPERLKIFIMKKYFFFLKIRFSKPKRYPLFVVENSFSFHFFFKKCISIKKYFFIYLYLSRWSIFQK